MLTVDTAVLQAVGWKAQHIRLPGYRERYLKARLSTFLVPAEASGSLFPEQGYWCWAQARAGWSISHNATGSARQWWHHSMEPEDLGDMGVRGISLLRRIAPLSLCESLCSLPVVKDACKSAKKAPKTGPAGL